MTNRWQGDLYISPFKNDEGQELWELVVCTEDGVLLVNDYCSPEQLGQGWLIEQLKPLIANYSPLVCEVFRPRSLELFQAASAVLNFEVVENRQTIALKNFLREKAATYFPDGARYDPTIVEELPPNPIPESLWGEQWRFATLPAGDLIDGFRDRPIPYLHLPTSLWPINLGLSSETSIPGVIVYGGKQSMAIAQWLTSAQPYYIKYIITELGVAGGLVLGHGLNQRSILATFSDSEIAQAGKSFEQKKQDSRNLHFLIVQPDESGVTYTGLWLLAPNGSS